MGRNIHDIVPGDNNHDADLGKLYPYVLHVCMPMCVHPLGNFAFKFKCLHASMHMELHIHPYIPVTTQSNGHLCMNASYISIIMIIFKRIHIRTYTHTFSVGCISF